MTRILEQGSPAPNVSVDSEAYPGYRLIRRRGQGSFADVWEAERDGGERCALKFIRCDGTSGPLEIRSLQVVRGLKHPYLLPVQRVWACSHALVVDMELADGSMEQLLETYYMELGTAMPAEHACHLLKPMAQVLDFLNGQHHILGRPCSIRHGDVKPSNMLLVGALPKLSDFGMAVITSDSGPAHRHGGSPDFAAPEVFRGSLTSSSDQYSLAVSYCHLRGRLPFDDSPNFWDEKYVRPRPDLSILSEAEQSIILKALDSDSTRRWPSCTAFWDRLCRAVGL